MKRNLIVLLTILVCGLTACKPGQKKDGNMEKETKLKIETSAGDIIVKLYNETPKHRDNFIKLAEEGTYEGTLFHRVIKDFMIQAGDPESKNAPKGKMLGAGDVGYTVPAEFVYPKYFLKESPQSPQTDKQYRRQWKPTATGYCQWPPPNQAYWSRHRLSSPRYWAYRYQKDISFRPLSGRQKPQSAV